MSYQTIRKAQQVIWPNVKRSIELVAAHRRAVHENPEVATAAAKARAHIPWNRVVANEAVWAIAKADLLNSPEQAAVIQAAREWARTAPFGFDMDNEERALYSAVQALATAPKNDYDK